MRCARDFPYFSEPFLALAHRGGASFAPNVHRENTVHAFGEAVALGYVHLETDVHATSDGVLLAFHDPVLDRVSDHSGRLEDLSYAEISGVRIGGLDPIPTLTELFEAFPDARFNIDAKSDRSVDLLAEVIERHAAFDRVCVSSFAARRLRRLRTLLDHRSPSAVTAPGVLLFRFAPWLARLVPIPGEALQIPEFHQVAALRFRVLTPRLLRAAHLVGKQVHVWTVNDADTMNRLIDLGVDGIFTDRIDTLKDVLQQRRLWAEPA
jgi:glycerophosphoryl diester phosphodiesterase